MTWDSRNSMSERQLEIFQKIWFLLEGTRAFGRKLTRNFHYLNATDYTDFLASEESADAEK
jgi:hypothetical protein